MSWMHLGSLKPREEKNPYENGCWKTFRSMKSYSSSHKNERALCDELFKNIYTYGIRRILIQIEGNFKLIIFLPSQKFIARKTDWSLVSVLTLAVKQNTLPLGFVTLWLMFRIRWQVLILLGKSKYHEFLKITPVFSPSYDIAFEIFCL